MYKTCFECPDIKQSNTIGRPLYYCGKILKITGEYFYIDKAGTIPRVCPLLKKNKKIIRRKRMENNNGGKPQEIPMNVTNEIIKLYQNDPISHNVIRYLLSKYKIIPVNALESIKQHKEEILLNIVLTYKKMWNLRNEAVAKKLHDKIRNDIIKKGEENESNQGKGKENRGKDNIIKGKDKQ